MKNVPFVSSPGSRCLRFSSMYIDAKHHSSPGEPVFWVPLARWRNWLYDPVNTSNPKPFSMSFMSARDRGVKTDLKLDMVLAMLPLINPPQFN